MSAAFIAHAAAPQQQTENFQSIQLLQLRPEPVEIILINYSSAGPLKAAERMWSLAEFKRLTKWGKILK